MENLDFDLKLLHTFITVVEMGSFTIAAKKMGQTQSSISQQIATLEKSFCVELINRSKRPIQLTVAGQELYQMGANLLKESKLIREKIDAIKSGKISSLRLGLVDSMGKTIGLDILKSLYPKVKRIYQITATAPDLLEALLKGKINLALTMMHTDIPEGIKVYPLIREEYLIVTPKNWPALSLEELCKKHSYIAYASWTPTGLQTLNWLKWRNLSPTVQFEIAHADDILRLIAHNYGWTLTTPLFLALEPTLINSVNLYPLPEPSLHRRLALLCKDGEFDDFCQMLSSQTKNILQNTLENNFCCAQQDQIKNKMAYTIL